MKKITNYFALLTVGFISCVSAEVQLNDGEAHLVTNSTQSDLEFSIVLSEAANTLNIFTQGSNGDADLELVEVNGAATDCEVNYNGSSEACVIKAPVAGSYRFKLNAYEAFTDVNVVASTEVYLQQHHCSSLGNETILNIQSPLISNDQIEWICGELKRAEDLFHQVMKSDLSTVPNDQNDTVYVNIFANQPAFMTTGQYVQDMQDSASTGIYFETNPETEVARANVNTFEAWRWAEGEFFIWELAHEYVHYLDGRYNKQGSYSTTLDHHMTWWTEGLAEYIADNASPYMNVSLVHSPENHSAEKIVQSGYDGEASPYDWGSMLVKFMVQERDEDMEQLRQMARSGNYAELDTWLLEWAENIDEDFQNWQNSTLLDEFKSSATELTLDTKITATSQHGLLFYVDLNDGDNFSAQTEAGGGDLDIYVQQDEVPNKYDATQFICRSNFGLTQETCSVSQAQAGRYYVLLDAPGYAIFANAELNSSSEVLSEGISYQLCSGEVPYSGRDSSVSSAVSLTNDSSEPVQIYWLNNNSGARSSSSYATLQPSEVWTANWYFGDTFVVVDESQNCLATRALAGGNNDLSFDGSAVTEVEQDQGGETPTQQTPEKTSSSGGTFSWLLLLVLGLTTLRARN